MSTNETAAVVLSFDASGAEPELATLVCPFCNHDHVHMHGGAVLQEAEEVYVDGDTVEQRPLRRRSSGGLGRGSTVETFFKCENECAFCLIFYFHKGKVSVVAERLAEVGPELWRD